MNVSFILIEPQVPENIGASARALKTMGFSDLRMVNPKGFPHPKAFIVAHASNDILNNSKIFTSLNEAVSDLDFLVATTAKKRSSYVDFIPLPDLTEYIGQRKTMIKNIGIVFGREESGLTNEELRQCHVVSRIPLATKFPSLNLSQAVMMYAYTFSTAGFHKRKKIKTVSSDEMSVLHEKAEQILKICGYKQGSPIYNRIMERMMLAQETDVHLLHSVCGKLIKKLNNEPI
ncbi:MAG: tRNA/rRNA methyltransferase [Bacteroidota bacterium]